MKANRITLALAFLITVSLNSAFASGIFQGQEQSEVVARKFDEFELTEIHYGDMKARLDNFVIDALTKEPESRAYLILYRSRNSYSLFRPWQLSRYLIKMRGVSAGRVKAAYGGYRKVPMLELWIVPEGAADPKATPSVFLKKRRKH